MTSLTRLHQIARNTSRLPEVWRSFHAIQNHLQVTAAYLLARPLTYPLDVRLRNGASLRLEDWDELTTAWHVLCGAEYTVPKDAQTILDLGANFGAFAIWVAAKAPNAKIVSVEPFPSTFARLREHIESNGLADRVTCLPLAVSGANGVSRFDATEGKRSYCRTLLAEGDKAPAVDVESITLQALLDRCQFAELDCLKMDVEGAEYDILKTSQNSTLRRVRLITMEYHEADRAEELWARLDNAGFRKLRLTKGGWSGLATFERID